jgi:hypothetical protein
MVVSNGAKQTIFEQDPGRYHPRFTATELNPTRNLTFSPNQLQRRSIYFEAIPEGYMQGGQPNPELNHKQVGQSNCSK